MRKFFAKHRTLVLILLGYLVPLLIIAWLLAFYFFHGLFFPSLLGEWPLKILINSILLYLFWLPIWTLGLIFYAIPWTRWPLKGVFGKVRALIKGWRKNWRPVLLFFFISVLLTGAFSLLGVSN